MRINIDATGNLRPDSVDVLDHLRFTLNWTNLGSAPIQHYDR
jgi:hypothetical protein